MTTRNPVWRLACLGALALGVTVAAQSQAPTFKSGVALVTVDVAVFDTDGRPVSNLGVEAFEVKLNGRVMPVRVVSYLEARGELSPAPAVPTPAPSDGRRGRQTATNAGIAGPAAAVGEDRVFVILVDDLSIPPTRGQRLLASAQAFVSRLPATDPVGLVRSSNAQDALNPTLDRAAIIEAIKRTSGSLGELTALQPQGAAAATEAGPDGFVGVSQALDIDYGVMEALKLAIARACFSGSRTEVDSQVLDILIAQNSCASSVRQQARQTAAMAKRLTTLQIDGIEAALRAMGQADGIRHLVVVSDGLAIGRDSQQLNRLAAAAASAGVQVSVLMEEHDMSLTDEGRRDVGADNKPQFDTGSAQRRIEDQRMYRDGLQAAATLVGGQFYRIVGDPVPFFERVRTASASIYRLGVEPPAGLQPGRSMNVEAVVKHPGVSVFVNRLAIVPNLTPSATPAPKTLDERLKDVIASGQQHGAVPVQAATLLRRAPGDSGGVELTINLAVPSSSSGSVRGPVAAMFGLVSAGAAAGAPLNSGRRVLEGAGPDGVFQTTFSVPVAAGGYQLRVAVADAEGALGAISTDVDATLPTLGPFTASDLLVSWVNAEGRPQLMALDPLPAQATGVRAELELYPPAEGVSLDDVQVEISVTRAGDTDAVDDRLVTPRDTGGVWRAATEFPSDMLEPGRYTLRARVIVGDTVVGSAIATFTK